MKQNPREFGRSTKTTYEFKLVVTVFPVGFVIRPEYRPVGTTRTGHHPSDSEVSGETNGYNTWGGSVLSVLKTSVE